LIPHVIILLAGVNLQIKYVLKYITMQFSF
jgi:hypothetical protein